MDFKGRGRDEGSSSKSKATCDEPTRVDSWPANGSLALVVASSCPAVEATRVNKLCIFVGTLVGSYVGWWAGEALGFEFFVNFLLSGVGSIAGVYAGWKLAQKLAE